MGLGLDAFLNHNEDTGKRKFIGNAWKNDPGWIVVWLHTRSAVAYPVWSHPFIVYGTFEDKQTNQEIPTLRYPRFVSPDPEIIHQSQYFREPDDRLRVPPIHDPFLKLREWLRFDCDLPFDTVIFRWQHPNPKPGTNPIIEWRRGNLARLVDKTKATFAHTLDTKLEYYFVIVDDANPGEGAQIVKGTKLIGDKMKAEIKEQLESNGADAGNPLIRPYAFKWVYDKNASSPMDSYRAFRFNQAVLTEPIREAITSSEFPDPSINTTPRAGDKAKIRAAMEAAAQVDLPWGLLFPDSWVDAEQENTDFNYGANAQQGAQTGSQAAQTSQGSTTGQPASTSSEGQPRRRKKKTVEMIPCDDCGEPMPITSAKCSNCGAEYEIDVQPEQPAPSSQPVNQREKLQQALPNTGGGEKCWSCGGEVSGSTCSNCGLDVSDDIPF